MNYVSENYNIEMETIKTLRKKLDGFSQVVERLRPLKSVGISVDFKDYSDKEKTLFEVNGHREQVNSPQITNCHTNLRYAKAWCGMMLGHLGQPTPYQNDGKRQDVKDIEPTDSKVDINAWEERNNWNALNHVQKVDFVRQQLEELVNVISGWFPPTDQGDNIERNRNLAICRTNVYNHLVEARFQMGFELERVRQESEKGDKDIDRMMYGGISRK